MKLARILTQQCRSPQVCCCLVKQRFAHRSAQYFPSQDVRNSPIKYPEKSLYVKKHLYDKETHKKYAAAMSYLKAKKRKGVGVFVENRKMISDLMEQGQTPSYIFYVKVSFQTRIMDLHLLY